mmetsp:Transcript_16172/g.33457  ORF Transcript_16172/g.33457 Transcript_16172/m.33457 type:complete len:96 (+) Transcript_16172:781-1068(+)
MTCWDKSLVQQAREMNPMVWMGHLPLASHVCLTRWRPFAMGCKMPHEDKLATTNLNPIHLLFWVSWTSVSVTRCENSVERYGGENTTQQTLLQVL